jgi:lycopene beta-cyclase
MLTQNFDYIIAGAGAAGLSLLVRMVHSGKFQDKRILLVDKSPKTQNDRTWCFWNTGNGIFNDIVHRSWRELWVHGNQFSRLFDISPYRYNMIRGIDFYNHCLAIIRAQSNITIQFGNISEIHSGDGKAWLVLDNDKVYAEYIFNSIIFEKPVLKRNDYYLLQHFKGWFIETATEIFNPTQATLMDFRTGQQNGTAFVYVMPFSSTTALVEYTLFSEELLEQKQYDAGLKEYIQTQLRCADYQVSNEEFGVIPMTNYRFPGREGNIIHIGTAGGQTKASSGYTFQSIQKNSEAIVEGLISKNTPQLASVPGKFHFYDSVLLNVLVNDRLPGNVVFTRLFKNNPSARIFRFLDNESSLAEDIRLISTLPTVPFLKAAVQFMS